MAEACPRSDRAQTADPLAERVARLVADAPPLTPDQRDRLAVLLRDERTPVPSSSSPVASAGIASRRLSAGATLDPHRDQARHTPARTTRRGLRRPAFGATPGATT